MTMPSDSNNLPKRARRWPALLVLVLGVALVVIFGLRAWRHMEFIARVERGEVQVQTLRGWMTLAYIERAYGVPETELRQALGLPAAGFDGRSVREWSEAAGLDPADSRHIIEKLILQRLPHAGAAQ